MATAAGTRNTTDRALNRAPMFSVITSVANAAVTIEKTIQSVLAQTCKDFEYLVIDAKSSDGTCDILRRYNDQIDYWCSEPDAGIYDAWNKGLRQARGTWIAFLGGDDQYYPDALQKYAELLSRPSSEALQYVSSRMDFMLNGKRLQTVGKPWSWPEFSKFMTVAHVGSMHHRSLFANFGEYDPGYRICGDYELLLRPRGALRTAFLGDATVTAEYGGVSNRNVGPALREASRAKRISGGRAAWRCNIEYCVARMKALVRGIVRGRLRAR